LEFVPSFFQNFPKGFLGADAGAGAAFKAAFDIRKRFALRTVLFADFDANIAYKLDGIRGLGDDPFITPIPLTPGPRFIVFVAQELLFSKALSKKGLALEAAAFFSLASRNIAAKRA